MQQKRINRRIDYDYWKHPEEGYPQKIWWKIIAGPPGFRLSILQEYDLIFDEDDYKIRRIDGKRISRTIQKIPST